MDVCKPKMTFEEKELAILRNAVDVAEERKGKELIQNPDVKKIISIVEDFLKSNKLMCYGGTAINNILPIEDQFYDKNIELPDYDFYSYNALEDAKNLANIYYKEGFEEVEAKAGVHTGTFKVYVNFLPVADITQMDKTLFNNIFKDSMIVNGIHYCPPNFLRMAMYLELSRPAGDISRWEKVMKRLALLNKIYPLKAKNCDYKTFQRSFEEENKDKEHDLYTIVRDSFIDQSVIFFGGYASELYSKYMTKKQQKLFTKVPDFDILSEDPLNTATVLKERLLDFNIKNVQIIKKDGVGEVIAPHYEIRIEEETVAFIYQPLACHSYNTIKIGKKIIKVATIDTMLSFYLAFIYAGREYYDVNRILCMSQYLFDVQQKNRLEQKGLLRRFSINCYGKQHTLEEIRVEKSEKFEELKNKKNTKEYEEYFLRYVPTGSKSTKSTKIQKTNKKSKKNNKSKLKNKQKRDSKKLKNKTRRVFRNIFKF
jgi:hypothetical protein